MDPREPKQQEVTELYLQSELLRATMVLSTGFGKSKVVINILRDLNPKKILILVNSTTLRDINWEDEFVKFDATDLFKKTEMVTYQTAYKWSKEEKDLSDYFIVADEIDFAADTDEYAKFFFEYQDIRTLGLTGFVTDAKKPWFRDNIPIIYSFLAEEAQAENLLNKLKFVFVRYQLSLNKHDYVVSYMKDGKEASFTQSENEAYDYAQKKLMKLTVEASEIQAAYLMGQITANERQKREKNIEYKIRRAAAQRQDVLLYSKSSQRMVRKLLTHIYRNQSKFKTIIFSKRTQQSVDILGKDMVYNGLVNKKKADENYRKFREGEILTLGACDKINRGANIDNLRVAIMESFFGSDTQAVQKFGRLMRLKPDEKATIYVMLPYYLRRGKAKEGSNKPTYTLQKTQQVKWAEEMLRSTTITSSTVWDYCTSKNE
jgi:superfamily II DNA or RNA helicase